MSIEQDIQTLNDVALWWQMRAGASLSNPKQRYDHVCVTVTVTEGHREFRDSDPGAAIHAAALYAREAMGATKKKPKKKPKPRSR